MRTLSVSIQIENSSGGDQWLISIKLGRFFQSGYNDRTGNGSVLVSVPVPVPVPVSVPVLSKSNRKPKPVATG